MNDRLYTQQFLPFNLSFHATSQTTNSDVFLHIVTGSATTEAGFNTSAVAGAFIHDDLYQGFLRYAKAGDILPAPHHNGSPAFILYGGIIDRNGAADMRALGARISEVLARLPGSRLGLMMPRGFHIPSLLTAEEKRTGNSIAVREFLNGLYAAAYDKKPVTITHIALSDLPDISSSHEAMLKDVLVEAEAMVIYRDLLMMPPNRLNPVTFPKLVRQLFRKLPVQCEHLSAETLLKQQLPFHDAVGKAAEYAGGITVLRYNGGNESNLYDDVLVGKGITFDSGGNDIKPSSSMRWMKMDMGGAALTVALLYAMARHGVKKNVAGVLCIAENATGANAMRPGDVYQAANGVSVEIDNTDAEGRLVLADGLLYAATLTPVRVYTLATLTGAARVALGHVDAPLFTNQQRLANKLLDEDRFSGDGLWQLPLRDEYREWLEVSRVATLANSHGGQGAGAGVAAMFLSYFLPKNANWVHVDFSNTCKYGKDITGRTIASGATTGRPLRTLLRTLLST